MKINIRDLERNDNKHFEFLKQFNDFSIGEEKIIFVEPVKLAINVNKNEHEFFVQGKLNTTIKLRCNRCLEYFHKKIKADFFESFISEMYFYKDANNLKVDDYLHILTGDLIYLDDFVKQNIILSIPVKRICSDNCKGLCSKCGTNLNNNKCKCKTEDIDPRLAKIKDYYKN